MRRFSFIIAILGIFVLIWFLFFLPPIKINSVGDLDRLITGQRIFLSGLVENERIYYGNLVLKVNGFEIVCLGCESYLGNEVEIEGLIDTHNKVKIEVLTINILS